MKAIVAAFNQEKALVGAFSVIVNLRMELFGALEQILQLSTKFSDNLRLHTFNILTYEQAGRQEVHLPPILPVLGSPASAPASSPASDQFPATRVKLVKLWSTINTRLENSAAGKRPSSTLVCRYK